MANWSVTTNDLAVPVGVQVGVLDPLPYLTITAADGYVISPENFTIGGATPDSPGSNKWIGGNVDSMVESVEFVVVSTTVVKANITLSVTTVFDVAGPIRIDIDESVTNPVTDVYGVCTKVQFPYISTGITSQTHTSFAETTEVVQTGTGPTVPHIKRYKHFENNLNNLLVFRLTVNPAATHNLINPTINISSEIEGFEGAFTTSVTSPTTGDNKIFSVYYTEPESGGSYTPCDFGHLITIDYTAQLISVADTNDIDGVNVDTTIGYQGGETGVTVFGAANAGYTMTIQNATNNYWYNFSTEDFQEDAAEYTGAITSSGTEQLQVLIPSSDASTDYNVIVESLNDSTLRTGVPTTNGALQIKQYGMRTLTITPTTDVPANFSSYTPTTLVVKRPIRYTGDYYADNRVEVINIKGLTDGSSTKVEITSRNPGIISKLKSGMIVAGDGIPDGITIKDVNRQYMTLSAAVSLATSTSMKCAIDAADIVPYSFTVTPGSAKAIEPNAANNHANSIWGFNDVSTAVDVGQSTSTDLKVDNTHGIIAKMIVAGTGIVVGTEVNSVNHATRIVALSQAHSGVTDDHVITFKGANNPSVKNIHIKAAQSSLNVVISGYLLVPKLSTSTVAPIFLDDIITVV
jgi:hypothetical protein